MNKQTKKRKIKVIGGGREIARKKQKIDNFEPLTVEELNNFRETQNVFNSNPFRSQIEELLKEERLKEKTRSKLDEWIEQIKTFLLKIDFSISVTVSNKDPVSVPNVLLPMKSKLKNVQMTFNFVTPKAVVVSGSYGCNCLMKDSGSIDIIVEIPKEVFQKEDYLNEKYLRKRNTYLACLASKLLEAVDDGLIDADINYVLTNNFDKPVLRLKNNDKKLLKYSLHIHVVPEQDVFAVSRFLPTLNNVRYGWYFDTSGDGKMNCPTPFYNSIVCHDLIARSNEELRKNVFSSNPKFKDAYILLKIWMRQRNLDQGLNSFSGFILAMFMVYLYNKKKINHRMGCNEIIRFVWLAFGETNWHIDGISLQENGNEAKSESMNLFRTNYEVVFVDTTGNANLASVLSLSTYLMVKSESKLAVQCLDDPTTRNFQSLFMKPVQLMYEFDHLICFNKAKVIRKAVKEHADSQLQLDLRSDVHSQFLKIVSKELKRALGSRVSHFFCKVDPSNFAWSVKEKMPMHGNVYIGLILDPEHAYNLIDKGPTANLPEATEFRQFWGTKSELRRFRDGDVCEAVCWAKSNDTLHKKRLIARDVVRYVLAQRMKIPSTEYIYVADELESVVFDAVNELFMSCGTGEEACLDVIDSFSDLSKTLRTLKDMPLEITSTQGTSAMFRYSAVFPTLPHLNVGMKKSLSSDETSLFFKNNVGLQHVPLYVAPIDVVIQFSSNNKWPTELDAIRMLQAAFYIKLSKILQTERQLICRPHRSHLDILKDGYVFRLRISNNNEITAVKREIENGEVKYCDNPESRYLERSLVQLPILTSAVHGLHQQHSAFGTASSIAKRWLRSQLLDEFYFPDICVDLLISYLCLNSQPYTRSQQPQTIFFRFLKLISSLDWFVDPIIINFNDELSREEILNIELNFMENRESFATLLLITPFDKSGSTWTSEQPTPMILKRLSSLAVASLTIVDSCLMDKESCSTLKQIFRAPLKGYDILIRTTSTANSCRWLAVDPDEKALVAIKNTPEYEKLPIVDFHPIRSYVQKLRKYFDEHCLFFYDFYGGNCIGVLVKPEMKLSCDIKVSNMKGITKNEKQNKAMYSLEAMMDNFKNLGTNIVHRVEKCMEM